MNDWEAVVLGVLQGATEFLPVSSSGHLVMGQTLLGISIPGALFEVAVHVATLISVLVVYRGRVWTLVTGAVARDVGAWRYLGLLALATVPAAVVGLGFGDAVEPLFDMPAVTGVALLVTGAFLWSSRAAQRRQGPEPDDEVEPAAPGTAAALAMGVVQVFALVPGISRSGATVVAALWMRVEAREAAAFSFLMAVPAIAGAAVLKGPELAAAGPTVGATALTWGFGVAAVTGVVAIRLFVVVLRRRAFHRFALYCWAAGGAFLLYLALR